MDMKIPPPTFCPSCRFHRRLAFRNEHTLFERSCDLCGKHIKSRYASDQEFKVFCPSCYYSDNWNPMEYGRPYDFQKTFFAQWLHLQESIPHLSLEEDRLDPKFRTWVDKMILTIQRQMEEEPDVPQPALWSDRSHDVSGNIIAESVNCYYCIGALRCNNVSHGISVEDVTNAIDVYFCSQGKNLYEVIGGSDLEDVCFSSNIFDGSHLRYCHGLEKCRYCFGCINLRKKSYCILNYQYSKSEYMDMVIQHHQSFKLNAPNVPPPILDHFSTMPFVDRLGHVYRYGEFFPREFSPFEHDQMSEDSETSNSSTFINDHLQLYVRKCSSCLQEVKTVYLKTEFPHLYCERCSVKHLE